MKRMVWICTCVFWNVSGTIYFHLISNINFLGSSWCNLCMSLIYCIVFMLWRNEKTIFLGGGEINLEVLFIMGLIFNQKCYSQWLKGRKNNWWRPLTVNKHLKIILLIKTLFEIAIPIIANFIIFYFPNNKHSSLFGANETASSNDHS